MTDEQKPGDEPQDPQPMAPGQSPADSAPPPPVNPYDQQPAAPDPAAPPPYGEATPPAYGEATPPAYGQAAPPPYGQAAASPYGQTTPPPYTQPGMAVEPEPSKAMAITALVLSLLCCFPIGLILAIVVLVRSRDGRNHGRGLAIGAVVASVVSVLALSAGVYGLTQVDWDELQPVEQLKTGDCIEASNLTDDAEDVVEDITEVPCDESHDAEVLVAKDLTQDEAENYLTTDPCGPLLDPAIVERLGTDLGVVGLTVESTPNAGDNLACIAYRIDGAKLDAPL